MGNRSLGLAVVVVGACAIELRPRPQPPAAPPRETHMALAISTQTLASGLRVVVVRDPKATEVQVTMRYRVGAIHDTPGMAHLVEHLMFEQQLDGQPLFTHLEDLATSFNAMTSFDATTYTSRAPTAALGKLLAIEATRLEDRCKTIGDAEFVREREVVVNELRQRDQVTAIFTALHSTLYPEGHPYRRAIGGSVDGVGAITREQACAFADAYYAPSNAVLVVSGPLAADQVTGMLASLRITKRAGKQPQQAAAAVPRAQHLEVAAPIDDDILVVAWPLPRDPEVQAKVRAIGAVLPRLVDDEIKGGAVAVELGDDSAPLFGLAVVPGDDETFKHAMAGTRRAIDGLPKAFRESRPDNIDEVVFDKLKHGAIYNLYSTFEDGSDRDARLARDVAAGRDPSDAMARELRALGELSRDEAADLAAAYFSSATPAVVTLKASEGKKRGHKPTLRAPVHDFGRRRTPVDVAAANRPATPGPRELAGMKTRVLDNGMTVVLLPVTSVPTFEARLIFAAGTADEDSAHRGVALLAGKALTWDLHHLNDVVAYARAGGMRDVDVSADRTSFVVQGLDMNLDVVLAGLRRWVVDGVYDDSAEIVVKVMHRSAKRVDDQGALTDAWRTALFGAKHPYVASGIVRLANNALTIDDAKRFRSDHYRPGNATLVIAGRFDAELADRWIDFLFRDWEGGATTRNVGQPTTRVASIAKADDTALVQLRIALPTRVVSRARRLVAAELVNEIAHEVRYRLGASYTLDAQLAELPRVSFIYAAGWVDAARATAAVELIRDRLAEVRRDPAAAFVVARSHVITALRSRGGSAGALAERIEADVALGRAPLSDMHTVREVESLTVADMKDTLAELDLERATVAMNGPQADIDAAFKALQRTPTYVAPAPASSAPGATPPAFKAAEQHVYKSDLEPALTDQPGPRLVVAATASGLAVSHDGDPLIGYSFAAMAGYRYGWTNAIGARLDLGRCTMTTMDSSGLPKTMELLPIDLLAVWYVAGTGRTWAAPVLGLHVERLDDAWRAALMFGVQGGIDIIRRGAHRVGLGVRFEKTASSDLRYTALGLGLVYRR